MSDTRYRVKRIFGPTIQGEGFHSGWPCLFVRLSGCNAWDGREETKAASACPYCDTDFHGGTMMRHEEIIAALRTRQGGTHDLGCVLSGGEPLLQADAALLDALADAFAWVDIESNGTRPCPPRRDNVFLSCSPKQVRDCQIVVEPDWWKILIPDQEAFLERCLADSAPVYLQATCPPGESVDGPGYRQNLARCLALAYRHGCRLSLQTHKYIDVE